MDLLSGIRQSIRIDVYTNPAAMTLHWHAILQSPNTLFEVVSAIWALKLYDVGIDVCHLLYFLHGLRFDDGVSSAALCDKTTTWGRSRELAPN